jgi:Ca2+-binding RTX toxin-like protein
MTAEGGYVMELRRAASLVSVSAMVVAASVVIQQRALADPPDPAVTALTSFLDGSTGSLQSWSKELGSVGKLADALLAVQASPGGALGFGDLLDKAFTASGLSSATDDAGLNIDQPNLDYGAGDGRSGSIHTHSWDDSVGKHVEVTLHVERTVTNEPLSIPVPIGTGSNAPQSAFNTEGGVSLKVSTDLDFEAVYDSASGKVYLKVDDSGANPTPALKVDVHGSITSVGNVSAAIGILGVSLVDDPAVTPLDLNAHFIGTVSDPNNDGRLFFTNPDGSTGELGHDGSLKGLVNFGFANPAGNVIASLHLDAAPANTFDMPLPQVDATVTWNWADISQAPPAPTLSGLSAGKFLNMTPRDLAVGIAQLVTSLTEMQQAKDDGTPSFGDLKLPFIKGSLSDAVHINELLKDFLSKTTFPAESDLNFNHVAGQHHPGPADDPAKGGDPRFVSLQEFLDALNATCDPHATGICISDVHYDDATSKVDFKLSLHHGAPANPVDLNAAAAASSGPASSPGLPANTAYTATGLSDPNQNWQPDEFKGRHVVAGNWAATIESNDTDSLTLDANGWSPKPDLPPLNTPYAISGMQGDVGMVELGDSLRSGGRGAGGVNAVNATAKVTPSYDASVTLVLDLEPPVMHDPPEEIHNADGTTTLLSSTPSGADRVLLRTSGGPNLFTADFPMTADADIFANAGFLQVEFKGSVKVCQSNAGADCTGTPGPDDHMLSVGLKDNGDMTFGDVVDKLLHAPTDLLTFGVHVRAAGGVDATVPGAENFFHGNTVHAGFHWNDLTQLTGTDGPQFDLSDLSQLANIDFDPSNPSALFSIILKTLQTLDTAIGNADPSQASIFNTKIPLVGRSLHDLLKADDSGAGPDVTFGPNSLIDASRSGDSAFTTKLIGRSIVVGTQVGVVASVPSPTELVMMKDWDTQPSTGTPYVVRSELDDAITILENTPADNLQALVKVLDDRFKDSTPLSFEYHEFSGQPSLVINLDWKRNYHTSAPFTFKLGSTQIAGAQANGSVSLGVGGEIKLGVVVPLAIGSGPDLASDLKILDDSKVSVDANASIGATVSTTFGPFTLSLGEPGGGDDATAHADYSIDLAKPGASGDPVSFTDFFSAVTPTMNASSNPVSCNLPDEGTPLALCAKLPLYYSLDNQHFQKVVAESPGHSNSISLRLPKEGSVSDLFDLTGAQVDGHDRLEVPEPADITALFSSVVLNFTHLDGIDSYLNLIETSLSAASFGGKLPLIGDDLQQGADFIGKIRTAMADALKSLSTDHADGNIGGDTGAVRTALNGYIGTALDHAGVPHDLLKIDTECGTKLETVTGLTVTPGSTDDGAIYEYEIASYVTDASGNMHEAPPSDVGQTQHGANDLAASPNDLQWSDVTAADGYHVYKRDSNDNKFKLIDDITGHDNHSYTDKGSDSFGAVIDPATENPRLHDCGVADFDSVLIVFDVTHGNFAGGDFTCPGGTFDPSNPSDPNFKDKNACIGKTVPLDIGIPGLSLRATNEGDGPSVQLGYHLHLAFGLSITDGFFVNANDEPGTPELGVGLNFKLSSGDLAAQLAFINVTAHNCTDSAADQTAGCTADSPSTPKPLFNGVFSIDLHAPGNADRLTLADLSGAGLDDLFKVNLKADLAIDWLLKAKPGGGDAGFPGIQTDFKMHWGWDNTAPETATGDDNHKLEIAFDKVAIDTGEIFGHLLSPIVNKIKQVVGPLDPIIKTLYAPIPVLSDLSHLAGGDDVTLISIAKAFTTIAGGPKLDFVDTIASVVEFIKNFPTCSSSCLIPLGSFDLNATTALSTTATPDNTESLIADKKDKDGGTAFHSIEGDIDGTNQNPNSADPLDGSNSQAAKAGFSFPVFEHPEKLFNLLLGGDVDLVKFDSGPLTLGFDWRQQFGPVYAPPPVVITLHGSASVSLHIVAGFDTYGIRKAFEAARAGTLDLGTVGEAFLQSLFFYTNDDNGKPIPVVSFNGEIAAGAAVTAVIITVGIEGGLGLTVSFLWNDPNHDGKFRISEFLQTALNNPICLFSVSGRLFVFLRLYITIGFGPFSVSFSFTIVDVTLLDFTATPNCTPPPPKLGALTDDGKTLVVYAAALGHTAQRGGGSGDPYESNSEDKDTVKITSLHNYSDSAPPEFTGVALDMLGIRREFLNKNIERVIVDGHGYGKPMSVTFVGDGKQSANKDDPSPTAQFDRDAIVFGGDGNDQIKTGIGNSYVDGGGGDDTIVTGDRTVLAADKNSYVNGNAHAEVAGGPGNDSITVGNGNDTVAGDSHLNYSTTSRTLDELINDGRDQGDPTGADKGATPNVDVVDWNNLGQPAGGSAPGDGNDPALKVGLGDSTIYGNGGNDTLSVGVDSPLAATDHPHALFVSPGATLVGGDGSDHIAGGSGPDNIYTAGEVNTSVDGAGDHDAKTAGDPFGPINVVDTGTGNDHVYGGDGYDRVTGHSTPDQSDDIRGGGGDDILVGGFGADKVYGGPDNDYVLAEPSTVDVPDGDPASYPSDGFGPMLTVTHTPLPSDVVPTFKTLVGGLGADHIVGGDGGADIYGDQQTTPCVAGSPVASDPVNESVDNVADGNDLITGGAGMENVRAGGGNDTVDVKGNTDAVCGEKGNDTLTGGSEADEIWGGSGGDVVNGDSGADTLYGNDGADTIYGGLQSDYVEGNAGADFVSGGEGDDVILGGTRAAGRADTGDVLNGDNGADTIIGDNGDDVGGQWRPLDLNGASASLGGPDTVFGGTGDDLGYGGLDNDTMRAGDGNDHFEGNNGSDAIFGEAGEDELVGGGRFTASPGVGFPDGSDTISGGTGADVITGDDAVVNGNNEIPVAVADSTDVLLGRGFAKGHTVSLLDLGYSPDAANSDGDFLDGNEGTDAIFGQGGADTIAGDEDGDYAEGGPGVDSIDGNAGEDDLVGGSSTTFGTAPDIGQPDTGDVIHGDDGADVVIGDNGKVLRAAANVPTNPVTNRAGMDNERAIVLYDLSPANAPDAFGDDQVTGDDGVDVIIGQAGNDRLKGNAGDDYIEGDQGSDFVEGDTGDDDLVGGSSWVHSGAGPAIVGQADTADAVYGGPGDDAVIGDNAGLLRVGSRTPTFDRIGSTVLGTRVPSRNLTLYDLNGPAYPSAAVAGNSGPDRLSGGDGVDVMYGQDGNDQMSGGSMADYLEGNGGDDLIQGDRPLFTAPPIAGQPVTTPLGTNWPGTAGDLADLEGASADGQDDMIGGSSIANFRDGKDNIEGDGEGDFQLGDNGVLRRDIQGSAPNLTDRIYAKRYPAPAPANAVAIRIADTSVNPNGSTRFCTNAQATCEKAGAFGDDTLWGDGGDDTQWGQDGNDLMYGGNGNDNMYGELGDDQMWGENGDDVMLGDRGGVVDQLEAGGRHYTVDVNQVPKVHYDGFAAGTLTRQTDLQHDVNGDAFVGSSTSAKMPHPGDTEGGNDRMRGGNGEDFLHAGAGDDLANGDSGGDTVFGDDGADVIWGGKGCDQSIDAATPDCLTNGTFDPSARGTNDRMVDYLFGGKGATSGPSVDPNTGSQGSDVIDWHPRGSYSTTVHDATTCTTNPWPQTFGSGKKGTSVDPCSWFEMTNLDNADPNDNQHHQGIDWEYGGWDRDVLQADVADNGPNAGDRLLDWNGAYNLYTHCNSAYGGYNDVRQHSPSWQAFLQQWAFSLGAGQVASDPANGSGGVGTSAFDELALVYSGGDNAHGSGSAYPSTPGHFDDPNACTP